MRKGETSVQNSSYLTPLYSQMGEYILFCSFFLLLIAGTETIVQPSVMFLLSVFSRPPWFDLPPPPYFQDGELASEGELPQYEAPQDPVSHPAAHPCTPSTPRTVATGERPSDCSGEESAQL